MKRNTVIFWICFVIFLIILIPSIYFLNFRKLFLSSEPGNWGAFGDYVGGILNPILSFSAFIILIVNLYLQHEQNVKLENKLNKEEIDRKIGILSPILSDLNDKIQSNLKAYPANNSPASKNNTRNNGSHPIYWKITDDLFLLYSFLNTIENLDPTSPFLKYFRIRYNNSVDSLHKSGYISEEINSFFKKPL